MASTYRDPAIARLTGSFLPTGKPPTFKPTCAAPAKFDPLAYIQDMRSAGVTLKPNPKTGQFSIDGSGPNGIPGDALAVGMKWEVAAGSDPDWIKRVGDALMAEQAQTDPVFDLIERHRTAYAAWIASVSGECQAGDGPLTDAESIALEAIACAQPTTIPGLRAWTGYVAEVVERDGDSQFAEEAISNVAAAANSLLWSTVPRQGAHIDGRLIALGTEFTSLIGALSEASSAHAQSKKLYDSTLPSAPTGLWRDPRHRFSEDIEYFTKEVPGADGQRYYTAKACQRLRDIPRTTYLREPHPELPGHVIHRKVPDPESQARVPAVLAAFGDWEAACKRHAEETGHAAAKATHERLTARYRELVALIAKADAVTLKGLAVQADVLVMTHNPDLIYAVGEKIADWAKTDQAGHVAGAIAGMFQEATRLRDRVGRPSDPSDEELDAEADELCEIEQRAVGSPLTTEADAAVALEWAICEWDRAETEGLGHPDAVVRALMVSARRYLTREHRPFATEATQAARAA